MHFVCGPCALATSFFIVPLINLVRLAGTPELPVPQIGLPFLKMVSYSRPIFWPLCGDFMVMDKVNSISNS